MTDMNTRTQILREAESLINGDRQAHYGPPEANFARIAVRWGQLLNVQIEPWQVCVMMADLKIARLIVGAHRDSFVDGAAYLALAGELGLELLPGPDDTPGDLHVAG